MSYTKVKGHCGHCDIIKLFLQNIFTLFSRAHFAATFIIKTLLLHYAMKLSLCHYILFYEFGHTWLVPGVIQL